MATRTPAALFSESNLLANVAHVFQVLLLPNVLLHLASLFGVRRYLSAATIFRKAAVRELPLAVRKGKNQASPSTAAPVVKDAAQCLSVRPPCDG